VAGLISTYFNARYTSVDRAAEKVEEAMDAPTDYYVLRSSQDRTAELRAAADAFRLTRTLAEQHAARFPRVRRLGAGLTGLAVSSPSRPVATPRGVIRRRVRPTADPGPSSAAAPCPC
jgi:hypothetical protein